MQKGKDHVSRRDQKAIRAAFYLYDHHNGIRTASKRRQRWCDLMLRQWRRGVYDSYYWWVIGK